MSPRPGGVLQEASKSGKLDEALELLRQEKEEVVQAAPEASSASAGSAGGGDAWGWVWGLAAGWLGWGMEGAKELGVSIFHIYSPFNGEPWSYLVT